MSSSNDFLINGKTIRELEEENEQKLLSPYASLSINSRGRDIEEPLCPIRTIYQRDRDRVLHCKAFRRLKDKTQVFLAPLGDHYRTRLTHTLEVAQIARTISKAIGLNEGLTEAIALAHDLGHTPFGHAGEYILNEICDFGFIHSEQSLRVVEKLENSGNGLNLSLEVRDGIKNHQTSGRPATLEGKVVQLSDKIAYINHDIDDAIRGNIISESDIPSEFKDILGGTVKERLNTLINDIIKNSYFKPDIIMSEHIHKAMYSLRNFMFKEVYLNPKAKKEEENAKRMLRELYYYYINNNDKIPKEYIERVEHNSEPIERIVCDYIAGMTDRYAIRKFQEIYIPMSWGIS